MYSSLFVNFFKDFLLKNEYFIAPNYFVKLEDEIFSRVYLYTYIDKNTNTVTLDVIHAVTPLIFEIDFSLIGNGQDDFSLSELTGNTYCVKESNRTKIHTCIMQMFCDYKKFFDFFNIHSIKDYAEKCKIYNDLLNSKSEKMDAEYNLNGYDYIILLLYLKEYDKCVSEIDTCLKTATQYVNNLLQDKYASKEQFESANEEIMSLFDLRVRILNKDNIYLSLQNTKFQSNIEKNTLIFKRIITGNDSIS